MPSAASKLWLSTMCLTFCFSLIPNFLCYSFSLMRTWANVCTATGLFLSFSRPLRLFAIWSHILPNAPNGWLTYRYEFTITKKIKYNARKIEAWKCCSNCGIQSSTYSTWTQYKEVLSQVDAIHTMKGITCSNDKRLTGQPTERKRLRLTDAVLLVWSSAVLIAVEELSYRPTLMCKLLLSAGTLVGTRNEKRTPNGSAHSRSRCYT